MLVVKSLAIIKVLVTVSLLPLTVSLLKPHQSFTQNNPYLIPVLSNPHSFAERLLCFTTYLATTPLLVTTFLLLLFSLMLDGAADERWIFAQF